MKSERPVPRHKRSCWSTFINYFPKALVAYLTLYSAVQSATATANTNIYMRRENQGGASWITHSNECENAAPHCVLVVTKTEPHGGVYRYRSEQNCDPSFVPKPVDEQLLTGEVVGQSLCNGILTHAKASKEGKVEIDDFDLKSSQNYIGHTQRFFYTSKQPEVKAPECPKPEIPKCPEPAALKCPEPPQCQQDGVQLYRDGHLISSGSQGTTRGYDGTTYTCASRMNCR